MHAWCVNMQRMQRNWEETITRLSVIFVALWHQFKGVVGVPSCSKLADDRSQVTAAGRKRELMMIRSLGILLLLSLPLTLHAQQSPGGPLPDQPDKNGFFQCGAGPRYAAVIPQEKYLEKGDSWGGIIGKVRICGGCDFADTPAHPVSDPPNHRTYAFIEWGDTTRSDLQLWLPDGELQVSSPHQYNSRGIRTLGTVF
jgi:hypothetical protein